MSWNQAIGSVSGLIAGGIMYNNSNFDAPQKRNYAQELKDTLQAQLDMAPQLYAAEKEYQPKYAALERETQRLQQEADVSSVEQLGLRSTRAAEQSDPVKAMLLQRLAEQTQRELDADGAMDPALRREVEQSARASAAGSGLSYGPVQAALEAMQVGSAREARRARAQQAAASLVNLRTQAIGDPFMQILGRSGGQGRVFNPESDYARDINDEQWNAEFAAQIMTKQAKLAALTGMAKAGSGYGGQGSTWGGSGGGMSSSGWS